MNQFANLQERLNRLTEGLVDSTCPKCSKPSGKATTTESLCSSCVDSNKRHKGRLEQLEYSNCPKQLIRTKPWPTSAKIIDEAIKSNKGIYLHGGYGTGKSLILAHIIWQYRMKQKVRAYFYETAEIIRAIQSGYGSSGGKDMEELAMTAPVLALDDLGYEKSTEDSNYLFNQIIRRRHRSELKTLLSCEWSVEELIKMEKMPESTASRIIEAACDEINMEKLGRKKSRRARKDWSVE